MLDTVSPLQLHGTAQRGASLRPMQTTMCSTTRRLLCGRGFITWQDEMVSKRVMEKPWQTSGKWTWFCSGLENTSRILPPAIECSPVGLRKCYVLLWTFYHCYTNVINQVHLVWTGIEGFYPEHIRQDMKWNRVVNLEGKPGCNISLDLVNELMNIEFKGMVTYIC